MRMKKFLSVIMSLVMFTSITTGVDMSAYAEDSSLIFNYVQSGQISWDGYTSYKFSVDSYINLLIDFDCNYTSYGARSPKIIIVSETDYNNWKIGKDVDKKYYSEAQTSNTYDFWCDDTVSLEAGNYRFIINNSQGWGYYDTSYTLCVTPIVITPSVSYTASCQSVTLNFKAYLGTQGYYIEQLIDNKYVNIKTLNSDTNQFQIGNLNPDTTYYFRIQGYSILNGNKYNSEWANLEIATEHTYKAAMTKSPTCTEQGYTVYICSCGSSYTSDYVSALGHNFGSDGSTQYCVVCGENNPNYVPPTTTSDNSNQSAVVISNSKNEKFSMTTPKASSIKKLTKGKKQFKVTWKKVTGVTGYQIQYSTDKKFKKNRKTVTVKGYTKTNKTIKNLKSNKKYYVRVRAYNAVKVNGTATKVYSSWSTAKSVKTK